MSLEKIIFQREQPSPRILEISLMPNNRLRWKVLPEGEQGSGGNFIDTRERDGFIRDCARRSGFPVTGQYKFTLE